MTKKKILISLAVGLIICCLTYMWFNPFRPKYTDCGTIQHKATKDEMNKYRLEVQPYLMVLTKNSLMRLNLSWRSMG